MGKKYILKNGKVYVDSEKAVDLMLRGNKFKNLNIFDCSEKEYVDLVKSRLGVNFDFPIYTDMEDYSEKDLKKFANHWLVPEFYMKMNYDDIENYFFSKVETTKEKERVVYELKLFEKTNSLNFLKCMIYISEIIKDNSIILGVGRGSSVSLYTLYLLGLHRVNSILYDLDPNEFFKIEE